jgi:type IV pilus assembly protein PilA
MYLHKNKKGFTLIELMVVVAIIGILALLGLRLYATQQDKAKESIVKANAGSVQVQLQTTMVDDGGELDTAVKAVTAAEGINIQNPFTNLSGAGNVAVAVADGALDTTVADNEGMVGINYSNETFTIIGFGNNGVVIPNYQLTAQR